MNTAPINTPTVVIEVTFKRSTNHAISSHAIPDTYKTHQ
jgi:hypothetical protein